MKFVHEFSIPYPLLLPKQEGTNQ